MRRCQHYTVTKGGVNTLFRGMARELAPYRIRVNAIGPPQEQRSASGRNCTAEDIAKAALFLVSDDAQNISGTSIRVDGALSYTNWPEPR
jgi:NAD(P)-dependent dehydrogenase (short-subunit alcohol dehydrogenase family)